MQMMSSIFCCSTLLVAIEASDANEARNARCKFRVALRAAEEVPASTSSARGEARIEIRDGRLKFDVRIDNRARESFTAGHIHEAPRGSNGEVVRALFPTDPQNQRFEARGFPSGNKLRVKGEGAIAAAVGSSICDTPQRFYVNFHSSEFPSGAVRGQLR